MGVDCAVVMKESADVHLSRISTTMNSNYVALVMCAVMALAALLVSYIMIRLGVSTVRTYYSLLGPAPPPPAPTVPASNLAHDDVVYADDADASVDPTLASNLQSSDNSRILASITRLKGKYAQYNTAMTDFAARVQNRVADDLMDESILSRGNDDFRYTSATKKI